MSMLTRRVTKLERRFRPREAADRLTEAEIEARVQRLTPVEREEIYELHHAPGIDPTLPLGVQLERLDDAQLERLEVLVAKMDGREEPA